MKTQIFDTRRMANISYRKGFEDGSLVTTYRFLHSTLGVTSFALFPALFSGMSAIKEQPSLQLAVVFFSISLTVNVALFLFHLIVTDHEFIWKAHLTKPYASLEILALSSSTVGLLCLLWFYSAAALIAAITCLVIVFLQAKNAIKKIEELDDQIHRARIDANSRDDFDTLTHLDAWNFTPKDKRVCNFKYTVVYMHEKDVKREWISVESQISSGDLILGGDDKNTKYVVSAILFSNFETILECRIV